MILKSPNEWSCLPTSYAMAMGVSLETVLEIIGHDGSAPAFESLRPWVSFHIDECNRAARQLGYACTSFDLVPISTPDGKQKWHLRDQEKWTNRLISESIGVMLGRGRRTFHAVCNKYGEISDPNGLTYRLPSKIFNPRKYIVFDLIL